MSYTKTLKSIAVVLVCLQFWNCNSNPVDNNAVLYNDNLIEEQLKAVSLIDSLYEKPDRPIAEIKNFREQLAQISEISYEKVSVIGDFKGNTGFRDAVKDYFNYLRKFYKDQPKLDTLIYMTNSKERLDSLPKDDYFYFEKEYLRYLQLEEKVQQEQLKFIQQFNIDLTQTN